jgi:hypothetical protein
MNTEVKNKSRGGEEQAELLERVKLYKIQIEYFAELIIEHAGA